MACLAMQCYRMLPCAMLCYATKTVSVYMIRYQQLLQAMLSYGLLSCCMQGYSVRCAAASDAGVIVGWLDCCGRSRCSPGYVSSTLRALVGACHVCIHVPTA